MARSSKKSTAQKGKSAGSVKNKALHSHFKNSTSDLSLPDKIVSAAVELLESYSVSEITFRDIAAHAGVSHMAPYRYFKTKEALYEKIAEVGFEKLTSTLNQALTEHPLDPRKQLQNSALAYLRFVKEHIEYMDFMFSRRHGNFDESELVKKASDKTIQAHLTLIHNCQLKGIFSEKQEALRLAAIIWSYVHGFAVLKANHASEEFENDTKAFLIGLEALTVGLKG